MGMFGSRANLSAAQQVARGGDGMDPSTMRPGFNSPGGWGEKLGNMGSFLLANSGSQAGLELMHQQSNASQQQAELQRMMQLAQYKAQNPEPTGTMQNVAAAGLHPGTPEYQAFMQKYLMQPHYITLGNAETGQQVIDANQMGGGAPTTPQVNEVVDGHVFLGGDPANPASWRAQ